MDGVAKKKKIVSKLRISNNSDRSGGIPEEAKASSRISTNCVPATERILQDGKERLQRIRKAFKDNFFYLKQKKNLQDNLARKTTLQKKCPSMKSP